MEKSVPLKSLTVIYCAFPKPDTFFSKHVFPNSFSYSSDQLVPFFLPRFVGMFLYFLTSYCRQMLIIRSVRWHYCPLQVTPPIYDLVVTP